MRLPDWSRKVPTWFAHEPRLMMKSRLSTQHRPELDEPAAWAWTNTTEWKYGRRAELKLPPSRTAFRAESSELPLGMNTACSGIALLRSTRRFTPLDCCGKPAYGQGVVACTGAAFIEATTSLTASSVGRW